MNRERAKELLPIIHAFAGGRKIEFYSESQSAWISVEDPEWLDEFQYRIKPERRKVWVHFSRDFGVITRSTSSCADPNCKVVCVEEPE